MVKDAGFPFSCHFKIYSFLVPIHRCSTRSNTKKPQLKSQNEPKDARDGLGEKDEIGQREGGKQRQEIDFLMKLMRVRKQQASLKVGVCLCEKRL